MTKQNTLDDYMKELENSENRLEDFKQNGIQALSSYDINIASSGDAKLALWTAKRLVNNHIKIFRKKISEMKKVPAQMRLF